MRRTMSGTGELGSLPRRTAELGSLPRRTVGAPGAGR
jgi:hypothetical protein